MNNVNSDWLRLNQDFDEHGARALIIGGLALGVGMLVDNAVVVLESIQRYHEEGQNRVDAAVNGVQDVAAAVTASTTSSIPSGAGMRS